MVMLYGYGFELGKAIHNSEPAQFIFVKNQLLEIFKIFEMQHSGKITDIALFQVEKFN